MASPPAAAAANENKAVCVLEAVVATAALQAFSRQQNTHWKLSLEVSQDLAMPRPFSASPSRKQGLRRRTWSP